MDFKLPIIKIDANKELIKWLHKRSKYSDNIFKDPGYSNSYKARFGTYNEDDLVYSKNDIDYEINKNIWYMFDEDTDNDVKKFSDIIVSLDHNKNNKYEPIVILPGTNHSNANFLFKEVMDSIINDTNIFCVPYVPNLPSEQFKGTIKEINMNLDKKDFYKFMFKYSY